MLKGPVHSPNDGDLERRMLIARDGAADDAPQKNPRHADEPRDAFHIITAKWTMPTLNPIYVYVYRLCLSISQSTSH